MYLSPLERVSVRRLCFYIEKQLRLIMRKDFLDAKQVEVELFKLLDSVKERQGIYDYAFEVGVVGSRAMRVLLGIQPKTDAELIWIECF